MEKAPEGSLQEKTNVKKDEFEYHDVKTLLSWTAPGRPYRKKGKEYYLHVLLIALLVEIGLFLFSQTELMVAVISVVFLTFVLAYVPPKDFTYKISTEGIMIEDHFYIWNELYDFYFKKIDRVEVLFIRTHAYLPGELKLTLKNIDKDQIRKILLAYLPYREVVRPTFMEKSADFLSQAIPLEKTPS